MRILLIEDNSHDVERVLRSFAAEPVGHRMNINVKHDAESALEFLFAGESGHPPAAANGRRPHLILLDLRLPLGQGMDVLRQVKADKRTRMIPVVVLTALQDESFIDEAYALGVNSYIVKPSDGDDFAAVLQTVGSYWVRMNEPPSY